MAFIRRYLIPRLIQYVLVIFLGVTAVFLIPRLTPTDPVAQTIAQIRSQGAYLDPATVDQLIQDLTELYGLEGSTFDQYIALWKRLFRGDFGFPSSSSRRRSVCWSGGRCRGRWACC